MGAGKRLGLVAHDGKKGDMVGWASQHKERLAKVHLYATGTTGGLLRDQLGLKIESLKSGPLGGDAQLGAMIASKQLDALVFFIDPLAALPHDVDVKSLLRLAVLYDIPLAINQASAAAVLDAMCEAPAAA
ncbi:MAG: methylglyoxal synthase [Betaproteobacteria bacterium AqS2]|uniref:Methylglyoxal synthase n=1 Tax=Candidatus Amphirhobacter heronislandensis TaxID=1732024 RepID=A0A930UDB3_9GAMM|nr:methylglyoxal synthase [Betaproteobacteria bacterium AqS2]